MVSGCTDDTPTTIHFNARQPPELVAFRDGIDGAWQEATKVSSTSFEAKVRGPYMLLVVCEDQIPVVGGVEPFGWRTSQLGRTLDDALELPELCTTSPDNHVITGHMAQAGEVQLDWTSDVSHDDDWDFHVFAPNGSYELIASTSDRIVVRRGIAVAGDVVVAPIDVAKDGVALADVSFSIANAAAGEMLEASVGIETPTHLLPFTIYHGEITAAKAAPDAALVAGELQTASLRAISDKGGRALRRPFEVGGDTAYTLPAALEGVQWAVENGKLAVSWTARPADGNLNAFAFNSGPFDADGPFGAAHGLDLSSQFVAATGITRATLDSDIAGFKAEWKVDYAKAHYRELSFQQVNGHELITRWSSEDIGRAPASRDVLGATRRISSSVRR